jgi:thiamine kinase-like enzyme
MLNKLILENCGLNVKNKILIESHFGTEVFLIETDKGKFIVKILPLYYDEDINNEGYITDYLINNGINVACLLKTKNGLYHLKTNEMQFHIQEFIEGVTLPVNTAPEWFLEKSAKILGNIHNVLKSYDTLKVKFGKDFFCASKVEEAKNYYTEQLAKAVDGNNVSLTLDLEERIKHLDRIFLFDIDVDKLTYSNSHGDYHIGQIISHSNKLTVIDWTSANKMPICLEVICSYVTESPACLDGKIDSHGLKKYMEHYSEYFSLNDYDIKMMPFVLYYQQLLCHYPPPYHEVPDTYKPICKLINCFAEWLYFNVENLSIELCK